MKPTTSPRRRVLTGLLATVTAAASVILASGKVANAQSAAVYTLTKTAATPSVTPTFAGATVSWTLKYKCSSATVACGSTVIKDTLPSGVSLVSADNGGAQNGATVDWSFPSLAAGDTGILTISGSVGCSTTPRTITNSATISGGLPSVTATAPITVNAASTCAAPPPGPYSKSGPSTLMPGGRPQYNFSLPARAAAYVVEDTLPAASLASFVSVSAGAPVVTTLSCDGVAYVSDAAPCAGVVKVRFLVPAVTNPGWAAYGAPFTGSATLRLFIPLNVPANSTIVNNAPLYTAKPDGTPGPAIPPGPGDAYATTGNVKPAAPITAISKYAFKLPGVKDTSGATPAGQTTSVEDILYRISYGNNGGGNAAGANLENPVITDLLDANTQWVPGSNWWTLPYGLPSGCSTPAFDVVPNFAGTGRTLLRWRFAGCSLKYNQDYNDSITIDTSVRMKPGVAALTNIANTANGQETAGTTPLACDQGLVAETNDLDGDGSTTDQICSAAASFGLPKFATFDSSKWVNGVADPATTWTRYPAEGQTTVSADGYATYHLFMKPVGNVDTTHIELVDVLPFLGDTAVSEASLVRLSEWEQILAGPLNVDILKRETVTAAALSNLNAATGWTPAGAVTSKFSSSTNPCRLTGVGQIKYGATATGPAGCDALWSAPVAGASAFALDINDTLRPVSATSLSGDILRITVRVKDKGVAASDIGKIAWNTFAYTATDGTGTEFLTAEPIKVGVRMTGLTSQQPSLGDYVWYDENRDGKQDAFEEGIDGVLVSLYDSTGALVRTTTTGVDPADPAKHGYYRFDGLDDSATYSIKTDRPADMLTGPLTGFVLTVTDADANAADAADNDAALVGATPTIATATTGAGATHTPTYDFGFWKKPNYSIGNRVWLDDDASGDMNGPDAGVDNVKVNLFLKNADGTLTPKGSDTTTNGGYYRFDGLDPANYIVQIDPSNFAIGGALEGRRSSTGPAQNPDPNSNIDKDDNGIDPATLADYTAAGNDKGVLSNVITLGPGKSEPAGETELSPTGQGAEDLRANMTVDFGFVTPRFAVGNYFWHDVSGDGKQGTAAAEPGINGVTVKLFKADGTPAGTTTTVDGPDGKSGFYLFDNLLAGDYYVEFVKPAGTVFTQTTAGTDAAIDSNADITTGRTANFTLSEALPVVDAALDGAGLKAGNVLRTIDAGITKRYSLGNLVWIDTNDNSVVDGSEAGIDGVTVELHAVNLDGSLGAVVSTQTTSTGGYYLFTDLAPGDYIVVIPKSQLAAGGPLYGYRSSASTVSGEAPAANCETVVVDNDDNGTKAASGDIVAAKVTLGGPDEPTGEPATPGHADGTPDVQSNTTVDFGFAQIKFAVGNYVWNDLNRDDLQTAIEPGINGVVVNLFKADGTPAGTTTTVNGPDGKAGFYMFDNLAAGDYYAEFVKPAGTVFVKPTIGANNAIDSNVDQATGRTANFTLNDALPVASATLDGAGLKASYVLRTIDAGISKKYSLGDLVWIDENNNSVVDGSEAGIDGVTVELHAANADGTPGALVSTQTTSSGGHYLFTSLDGGDYVVVIPKTQLAPAGALYGYQSSATTAAGEPTAANAETVATDNDDNGTKVASGDVVSAKVTLGDSPEPTGEPATPGHADSTPDAQSNTTVDFGFAQVKFAVGNYVWNDLTRDDLQSASEPGINGVVVNLFKADGTPAGTTTTVNGPDGKPGFYMFDDLAAGTYYAEFVKPAGTVFVKTTIGSDNAVDSNVDQATGRTGNFTLDLAAGLPVAEPAKDGAGLKATYVLRTIDAGISKKYSLGDLVWIDTNNNSIVDGSEAGIDGVTVELHAANADGTPGALVSTQTTNTGGYYLFTNLDGGDYVVVVPKSQLAPGGSLYGYHSSATSAAGEPTAANAETVVVDNDDNGTKAANGDVVSAKVTLGDSPEPTGEPATPGHGDASTPDAQSNTLVDFGFTLVKFAVGNYVWEDVNNDGLQNEASGMNGLTVSLFKADGTPAGTTTTVNGPDGKPGFYLFDDLLVGDYYMVFTKPDGTVFTKNTTGSPALDSNADGAGKTAVFTLNDKLPLASPALEGTGTKATYVLRDVDAGFSKRYTLGNLVWNDENGNAKADASEAGIDGVVVELHAANADGTPGALVSKQTTSTGGYYQFTDLFAGDYVVVIPKGQAPLTGFWSSGTSTTGEATAPLANSDIDNDDNGTLAPNGNVVSSRITLGPGAEPNGEPATPGHADTTIDANSNLTVDFGFISMSLGNLVWEDTDNDGTRNGTEPVIADVKVLLYLDSNGDGVVDGAAIATMMTNAEGQYLFTGLKPGKYIVQIEPPAGMYSSSGTPGFYKGPFESGKGDNTALDTQDHGTTVDNRIQSATIMLTPGTEPTSAVETDGVVGSLTNPASDSNTDSTVDFGLVPGASIGNYVWLDNNRDGIQNEAPDAGINGVTVRLIDKAGNVVKTTVTTNGPNGPGYYRFDVIPGDFKIAFDLTTLPEGMVVSPKGKGSATADSDADPANGMTGYTTLDPREDDPTWDMGVYPTAVVVGNFVWLDLNGDGIQNDGPDSGFPGVKVTIYDASGKPVTRDIQGNPISSTQTTDAGGQYLFSNLKPGSYTVKFELPNGYEATTSKVGDSATDSNGLVATSKALKGGQSDLTLDLGLVKPAKIFLPIVDATPVAKPAPAVVAAPGTPATPNVPASTVAAIPASEIPVTTIPVDPTQNVRGNVFLDNNKTASKEGSEPGKSGVVVRLLDKNGKVVATTTTDVDGNYGFKAEPGDYIVEIVTPDGLSGTTVTRSAISVKGAQLTVVESMGLANGGFPAEVAFTGANSAPLAAAAVLLLLAGVAMVLIARRRKQEFNS